MIANATRRPTFGGSNKRPLKSLRGALVLIGAEVAFRGWGICCPRAHNYERFFERAPAGTVEIAVHDADHVADLPRRHRGLVHGAYDRAARALVSFFSEKLTNAPPANLALGDAATMRVKTVN